MVQKKKDQGKKDQGKKMSLQEFLQESPSADQSWGEQVEEEFGYEEPSSYSRAAPSAAATGAESSYRLTPVRREGAFEPSQRDREQQRGAGGKASDRLAPTEPPYVAFLTGFPYECTIDDLGEFFDGEVGCRIKDIVLRRDRDTGKPKFAYMIFEDVTSLNKAVNMHNTQFGGRRLTVDYTDKEVAERIVNPAPRRSEQSGGEGSWAEQFQRQRQERTPHSGGGAFGGDRPPRRDREPLPQTEADLVDVWRRGAPRETNAVFGGKRFEQRREKIHQQREGGAFGGFGGPRRSEHPPRTEGEEESAAATTTEEEQPAVEKPKKESIFGEGKPWDGVRDEQLEKRLEEKLRISEERKPHAVAAEGGEQRRAPRRFDSDITATEGRGSGKKNMDFASFKSSRERDTSDRGDRRGGFGGDRRQGGRGGARGEEGSGSREHHADTAADSTSKKQVQDEGNIYDALMAEENE